MLVNRFLLPFTSEFDACRVVEMSVCSVLGKENALFYFHPQGVSLVW